ncbi:MAG: hypothetical protein KJ070_12505 [Verrucomicrobia bacterium]|nr:hypothetical protein [Verrucomicrobiota bacterium]
MHTVLIILATFLGLLGFAFTLAGVLGMFQFDRKEGVGSTMVDAVLSGGVFTALGDLRQNWMHRPAQRRFIYLGIICVVLCGISLVAARRLKPEHLDQAPPASAGLLCVLEVTA